MLRFFVGLISLVLLLAIAGAGGCPYTCKPQLYFEPSLACDQPCVYLLNEEIAGRIMARVGDYVNRTRPRYVQGVCHDDEALPHYILPFLRRGAW